MKGGRLLYYQVHAFYNNFLGFFLKRTYIRVMVKKHKQHNLEYYDKEKKKWIKVMMDEVDETVLSMHDYVIAQIEIATTKEEIKNGDSPEKN